VLQPERGAAPAHEDACRAEPALSVA
jgi:hypothetical protein